MAFLLLVVSLFTSVSFYALWFLSWPQQSLGSFFWVNSFSILSLLFFVFGCIWFVYFYIFLWSKSDKEEKNSVAFDYKQAQEALLKFFRNNLYYVGFIFLYLALYFIIGPSVWYDFWYFIFIISFIILILFFVSEKFSLFRDLIKINTILFSLYYIISYLIIFITGNDFFGLLDLLNQIFIIAFFVLNIYNDKTLLKNKINDTALISYGFTYLLLFCVFYISLGWLSTLLSFVFIGTILSFVLKNFISEFSFFQWNAAVLKILSLIFWYIALFSAMFYFMLYGFHLFAFVFAAYLIIDNIIIHNNYQNYSSFSISLVALLFFYAYLYFSKLYLYEIDGYIFLLYGYMLYFWAIILWYIQTFKYKTDYYFIYSFFYGFSIVSMLYFLFSFSFELFDFWVMLLLQSILTFMVYYKFNTLSKHEQQNHLS